MGPKYEFTGETMNHDGHLLHRIRRLSDGKLGGWIESEENLSQEGGCWVADKAIVSGNAQVSGNAKVSHDAIVYGNAQVSGNASISLGARVYGNARVYDDATVYDNNTVVCGNAQVYGDTVVSERAKIDNNAKVYGRAVIYRDALVYGDSEVYGNACICGGEIYNNTKIYGEARVWNNALVYGNAKVYDSASIHSGAEVYGDAEVCGNAIVLSGTKIYNGIINGDNSNNEQSAKIVQDFIYKVDDSNKLTTQTEYDSIDEFFNESITNDIKLDTLIICTADTKIPIIKFEKIEKDKQLKYKFIVDLTTKNEDHFLIQSFIETKEQLSQKLTQTIDALNQYPEFSKYTDDLEEVL